MGLEHTTSILRVRHATHCTTPPATLQWFKITQDFEQSDYVTTQLRLSFLLSFLSFHACGLFSYCFMFSSSYIIICYTSSFTQNIVLLFTRLCSKNRAFIVNRHLWISSKLVKKIVVVYQTSIASACVLD